MWVSVIGLLAIDIEFYQGIQTTINQSQENLTSVLVIANN